MKHKNVISLFLCVTLLLGVFGSNNVAKAALNASYTLENLVIEAASDTDLGTAGATKAIDFINPDFASNSPAIPSSGAISLFSEGNRPFISNGTIKTNTAIVVDSNMVVTNVINKAPAVGQKPSFTEATDVTVPTGGFVLLACDSSYANAGYKKFIAENFEVGDIVKLKLNGAMTSITELLTLTGQNDRHPTLSLNYTDMYTTHNTTATISGRVNDMKPSVTYQVNIKQYSHSNELLTTNVHSIPSTDATPVSQSAITVSGSATTVTGGAITTPTDIIGSVISVAPDGSFHTTVPLQNGVNYFDITIIEDGILLESSLQSEIIFQGSEPTGEKPVVLWIDQFASAKSLNTVEKIQKMVSTAKKAGVTAFAFDVKGCEGYASYKKATLTNTPYMTETKNPNKYVNMEIDFLEEMITAAHNAGIKLYASYNFFVEGNLKTKDSAIDIFHNNTDWSEVFYTPEDNGELKSVYDSARTSTLIYVNPANDEVCDFQLRRVEEVLENYDVDGIIMDRCRYDNQYADFSDVTKAKFETYLTTKGKSLINWPQDVYTFGANNAIVPGPLYYDWLTFRSSLIKDFATKLRLLIDDYETSNNKDISLSTYVGSWYESYYQNGVNWADDSFIYNDRLGFPMKELYTPDYAQTSYLDALDFIMIGCYYKTEPEIAKYTTLGNILVNNQIPLIGSIDLTNLKTAKEQRIGFQAAYNNSHGGMIFDLCFVNWYKLQCAIKNLPYENPLTIGCYNPTTKEILSITDSNTARAEDSTILYTEDFGDSTGTNQYGVEVVVDSDGYVTNVVNKTQASQWSWGSPELNNSTITPGGFVLSTTDKSGSRYHRQLFANSFSKGDKTAAAVLSGYVDYKANLYNSANETLTFTVASYGAKDRTHVTVNGTTATLTDASTNTYALPVTLKNGANDFEIKVFIDDLPVITKTITLTGTNITETPKTTPTTPPSITPSEPSDSSLTTPTEETPKTTPTEDVKDPSAPTTTTKEIKNETGKTTYVTTIHSSKEEPIKTEVTILADSNKKIKQATATIATDKKPIVTATKKTSSVKVSLPADTLLYAASKLRTLDRQAIINVTVKVPEKELTTLLQKGKTSTVTFDIILPNKIAKHKRIRIHDVNVTKNILKQVRDSKKNLVVQLKNKSGKLISSWNIRSKNLNGIKLDDVNLGVNITSSSKVPYINKILTSDKNNIIGTVIQTNYKLESSSTLKVKVSGTTILRKGNKVYVYKYDKDTKQLIFVKKAKVDKHGYIRLNVTDSSDYVLLKYRSSAK